MGNRKSISNKIRFDIFKRDFFTCQYCGATPPKVILNIDHITPVSRGGDNNPNNLITSCFQCNIGKFNHSLTEIPKSIAEKAAEIKERELQIIEYNKILNAKSERLELEAWKIAEALGDGYINGINRDWFNSIKIFIDKLGYHEALKSMEIARQKRKHSDYQAFKYFCGICWNKIRSSKNGEK